MDLLSIAQTLWRHKRIAIPIIVLTLGASFYVVKIKAPVYQASASVLLTSPQGQATQAQIAADPSLKKASSYNPFVSYGSLNVVANAVMELVTSPSGQPALLGEGVDPRYKLALSTDYGSPPIIDITGVGATPEVAIKSASRLTSAIKVDLVQLQQAKGVNPFYMIGAVNLVKPTQAQKSTSGNLRSLVAVLAGGIIVLFIAVSMAEAIEARRKGARQNGNRVNGNKRDATQGLSRQEYGSRIDEREYIGSKSRSDQPQQSYR